MLQHSSRIFLSNAKGKQCFPLHSNDLCLWRVLCMGLCFKLLASYGWFSGLAPWNRFSGSIRMSCPMQVAANDVTFSAVKKACARGGSPNSVGHWRETCELLRKMPFLGIQLHLGRKSVVDMEPWKCHGEVLEKSALEKSCIGKHKRSAGDERCKGLEKVSQTSSSEEWVFHWKAWGGSSIKHEWTPTHKLLNKTCYCRIPRVLSQGQMIALDTALGSKECV